MDLPVGSRRAWWGWCAAAMVTAAVIFLIPLIWQRRWYFYGDTQIGAFGQWWYFGKELLEGHWPLLNLGAWRGGNYAAEGQMGLFNPMVMVIGVLAYGAKSALVFCTLVKVFFTIVAVTGTFLLCRSYRIGPAASYVASTAIMVGGVTQYLDLATWVTGLMVWSMLPWAWWAIRRAMIEHANPLPALLVGYLIVTIGYVYGTIYLALVVVACLIDAFRLFGKAAFGRVLLLGTLSGLLAVTIYLPGILTAPVTTRSGFKIINDGSLALDPRHFFGAMIPFSSVPPTYKTHSAPPVGYIAWFLPVLLWLDQRRLRAALRPMVGMVVVVIFVSIWALGPTGIGPLRYPARVMPVVVLCVVILTMRLLTHAVVARPGPGRLALSLLWVVLGSVILVSRALWLTPEIVQSAALVLLALLGLWFLVRRSTRRQGSTAGPAVSGPAAIYIMTVASVLLLFTHYHFQDPASTNRNMPAAVADYSKPLQEARGDVIVVGDQRGYLERHPEAAKDILIGSAWYLSGHPVSNSYSTIGFQTYNKRYCFGIVGNTCKGLAHELFTTEPTTGQKRVDLLSASTILLFRPSVKSIADQPPPAGWHVAKEDALVVMWVRDDPIPTAGGIAATSDGTTARLLSSSEREARVRIDTVGPDGGTVTFSRLDWPGYSVTDARQVNPVDGYLLTIRVPSGSDGRTVSVRFTPPGFGLGLVAWGLSVGLSLGWSVFAFLLARRRGLGQAGRLELARDHRQRADHGR